MFGIQAGMIWDLLMKAIEWSLYFSHKLYCHKYQTVGQIV